MERRDLYKTKSYTLAEILDHFSVLKLKILPSDILKPTSHTTIRMFESLLEFYTGISSEAVNVDTEFVNTAPLIITFKRMNSFLGKLGVALSLRDLLAAESMRLLYILSVIVNFSMFRDGKSHIYERIRTAINAKKDERKALEDRISIMVKECNVLKKKNGNKTFENEQKEVDDLVEHLRKMVHELKLVEDEAIAVDNAVRDKTGRIKLIKANCEKTIAEIERMKEYVVEDAKKLVDEIGSLSKHLNCDKNTISGYKTQYEKIKSKKREFRTSIEGLKVICGEVHTCLDILNEQKLLKDRMRNIEEEIKNRKATFAALKLKSVHMLRQIETAEVRIARENEIHLKDNEKIEEDTEKIRLEIEKMRDKKQMISSMVTENEEETKKIENDVYNQKIQHNNEMVELFISLQKLKDKMSKYFLTTNQGWKK